MKRRWFLLGASALACAPTKSPEVERKREAADTDQSTYRLAASDRLVVVGQWSSMMTGSSIAVYSDGLIDHRWTEFIDIGTFGEYVDHFRVAVADPSDVLALREALGSPGFLSAKAHYREAAVHDGGAITISDPASHRRIIVVNDPADLPPNVGTVSHHLEKFAARARKEGTDPFTSVRGPGRLLLVHEFITPADRSFVFTAFDNGLLELRLLSDPNDAPDDATDFPTPRSTVIVVDEESLSPLRQAIAELQKKPPSEADLRGKRGPVQRIWVGGPKREITVRVGFTPPLRVQRLIEESRALAGGIEVL